MDEGQYDILEHGLHFMFDERQAVGTQTDSKRHAIMSRADRMPLSESNDSALSHHCAGQGTRQQKAVLGVKDSARISDHCAKGAMVNQCLNFRPRYYVGHLIQTRLGPEAFSNSRSASSHCLPRISRCASYQ